MRAPKPVDILGGGSTELCTASWLLCADGTSLKVRVVGKEIVHFEVSNARGRVSRDLGNVGRTGTPLGREKACPANGCDECLGDDDGWLASTRGSSALSQGPEKTGFSWVGSKPPQASRFRGDPAVRLLPSSSLPWPPALGRLGETDRTAF